MNDLIETECNPNVFPGDCMSPDIRHISAAVVAMQSTMEHASKDSQNPHFKSRYADLASCWTALKPHLTPNGLAAVQTVHPAPGPKPGFVLRTLLVHAPSGQWFRSDLPLYPNMDDPQKVGSALTYARRYGLCAITGLYQDDDDANLASGPPPTNGNGNGYNRPPADRSPARPPAPAPSRPAPNGAPDVRSFPRYMQDEAAAAGLDVWALVEGVMRRGIDTGFINAGDYNDDAAWKILMEIHGKDRPWLTESVNLAKAAK